MDANLTSILQVALQQGIWAALYIYLFFRMLKENAEPLRSNGVSV